MKFGGDNGPLQFPFLPASVPRNLYDTGEKVNIKKVVPVDVNPCQKQLIRAVVQQINPAIFKDSNIFPVSVDIMRAFAAMIESGERGYRLTSGDYLCYVEAGSVRLQNVRTGFVVVEGTPGEVFAYATKYCRQALRNIVMSMRAGLMPRLVVGSDLAEMLSRYRKERSFSKGLDLISKTDELGYIDQEDAVNKFVMEEGEAQHPKCLHLGSGTNISSSQLALFRHYNRVVLVDPRCQSGEDSKRDIFIKGKVKEGWDVVCDIAVGDAEGMTLGGQKKLVEDLYSLSGDRLVVCKMGLQKGIKAKGILRRKPRPHNLEVIVTLTPEGEDLDQVYADYAPGVISANEVRNQRVFQHLFGGIKSTFNGPWDLTDTLMARSKTKLPRAACYHRPRLNRNDILAEQAGGRAAGDRYVKFSKACGGWPDMEKPSCILPDNFHLAPGRLRKYDPCLPDADFSVRSLVRTAKQRGYDVALRNGQLIIF